MMKIKLLLLLFIAALVLTAIPCAQAQLVEQGKIAVFANGGYTHPLGDIKERYKGTYNFDVGFNYAMTPQLMAEFRFVYGKFDKTPDDAKTFMVRPTVTTSTEYAIPPGLDNWYRYAGITPSLIINIIPEGNVIPYLLLGTGLYRFDYVFGTSVPYVNFNETGVWDYYRDPDTGVMPTPYQGKHHTQWALGVNGGFGLGFKIGANAVFDVKARWEMLLSDLWPVLHLGLLEVRPIQYLQLTGGIRFIL